MCYLIFQLQKADYLNCIIEIRVPNTYCKNIRIQEQTFNLNSALIISKSLTGSTESSTWMMSESSNAPIRLSWKNKIPKSPYNKIIVVKTVKSKMVLDNLKIVPK
ncbi:hypothetical protein V6Z11_D13G075400 [Gossypium hirsutum]